LQVYPTGDGENDIWGLMLINPGEGWTVDASHDQLKLEHDGSASGDIAYDIVIIGVSA